MGVRKRNETKNINSLSPPSSSIFTVIIPTSSEVEKLENTQLITSDDVGIVFG